MANTLYISYTGLMDPLGQSQVLQYVLGLSKDHKITVISFEKPENLNDKVKMEKLRTRMWCRLAGVEMDQTTFNAWKGS